MKKYIQGPLQLNARSAMRYVGYGEHLGHGGQISYTKRLQGMHYPRFHAYVEDINGGIQINLHLDQKKASYKGSSAHCGDYESPLVEKEMNRVISTISGNKILSKNNIETKININNSPVSPKIQTPSNNKKTSNSKYW